VSPRDPSSAATGGPGDLEREVAELRAVRLLVGGLAHDFNNLLTAISGHAALLEMEAGQDSEARESAAAILKASQHASALARKLQGIAEEGKRRREPVDLHQVVDEVSTLLKPTTNGDVEILHRFSSQEARIMADPVQIHQLVLNLALNARDSMPDGGQLTFETRRHTESVAEEHLVLSVRDTGCGIAHENLSRIFEPFFTDRSSGSGTGLGLSVVAGVVKKHRGRIQVESEPGCGSAFHVFLPLAAHA